MGSLKEQEFIITLKTKMGTLELCWVYVCEGEREVLKELLLQTLKEIVFPASAQFYVSFFMDAYHRAFSILS